MSLQTASKWRRLYLRRNWRGKQYQDIDLWKWSRQLTSAAVYFLLLPQITVIMPENSLLLMHFSLLYAVLADPWNRSQSMAISKKISEMQTHFVLTLSIFCKVCKILHMIQFELLFRELQNRYVTFAFLNKITYFLHMPISMYKYY